MNMNVREGMRRLGILLGVLGAVMGGFAAYEQGRPLLSTLMAHRKFESLMASPAMRGIAAQKNQSQVRRSQAVSQFGGIPVSEPQPPPSAHKIDYGALAQQAREHAPSKPPQTNEWGRGDPIVQKPSGAQKDGSASHQPPPSGWTSTGQSYEPPALPSGKIGKYADADIAPPQGYVLDPLPVPVPDSGDWEITDEPDGVGGRHILHANELLKGNKDGIEWVHVNSAGIVDGMKLVTGEVVARTPAPNPRAYLVFLLYPALGFLIPWGAVHVLTWVGGGFFAPRI